MAAVRCNHFWGNGCQRSKYKGAHVCILYCEPANHAAQHLCLCNATAAK